MPRPSDEAIRAAREQRAAAIQQNGLPQGKADLTLSEALVLGLLKQGVKVFLTVFGHGSTEVGEVLRIYQEAGLVRVYGLRSEIEASHAASALRWITGEKAAVVTSIGPGALQALAASIMPASDGLGVYYLFGDETTEDEGYNMQQIPRYEQGGFLKMMSAMGKAYSLHTPLALSSALQAGAVAVDHPYKPSPFYLLMPMNTQAAWLEGFNLDELPTAVETQLSAAAGDYQAAVEAIRSAKRVLVKAGGGAVGAGEELITLLELTRGVLVHTPIATGCISFSHPANMGVGGSKGSLCGNFAMEQADLLIAVGTRAVCQSDCSRTGYPLVKQVININSDPEDALHYNHTLALTGDAASTLRLLNQALAQQPVRSDDTWRTQCTEQKNQWLVLKEVRRQVPTLHDDYWQREVLTQPAAILTALDWAKANAVVSIFDAGDVQANGFQIVEDEAPGLTITETGASYMGFAVSALLATGTASKPFYGLAFTGDGSFTMNPQVLIDGAEHGARGCILLMDNGRMGAISGLQNDQYQREFATANRLQIDYLGWARAIPGVKALDGGTTTTQLIAALNAARRHEGLSLIHVQVYYGADALGGMGVYGRWNVGNWCDKVQALRHEIGL
ncbi:MAG: thiamine pyrophosphate-binding protein [Chloroflexi bacterium HGW-Chloroflexi-4]|jgi:3D-(3,5/4)-trihydroxycyclohexane-1,2-dione acylhydrolase (decyclizing)|nr:MAG: thiamine pyrophosphate-binding protein [Chloroflexi bacterium HGW-Chloroflexi-4]